MWTLNCLCVRVCVDLVWGILSTAKRALAKWVRTVSNVTSLVDLVSKCRMEIAVDAVLLKCPAHKSLMYSCPHRLTRRKMSTTHFHACCVYYRVLQNVYLVPCPFKLLECTSGDRLVGLVVKASASRAEDPGFESRLRRDFFGVESYQWLKHWHSSGYPARRLAL